MRLRVVLLCALIGGQTPNVALVEGQTSKVRGLTPNFVFIQTDDHAPWALRLSGHPDAYTPNLDRLFRSGAYLRNSFTVTPVCSPSRASLLSSRYGTELGITDWINPKLEPSLGLSPDTPTWSKALADAGYTNALIGKWHLGTEDRFHPRVFGFTHFMGFRAGGTAPRDPTLEVAGETKKVPGFEPDILTDDAIAFVRARRNGPFVLFLNYRSPHAPYLPVADEDWARFKDRDVTIPNPDYPDLDVAAVRTRTREYLASVAGVDRNVGRLLAVLDEAKISDRTIVIFTSDHGYNIGHHGIWHKGNGHLITRAAAALPATDPARQRPNMFDNSLRVPTAIRWPGRITPGTVVDGTVTNLDWYPTILAMAGVSGPRGATIRGRSIVPLLDAATKGGRRNRGWDNDLYAEYSQHHYVTTEMRAYRTPEWKLVRDFRNAGRDELYHLASDPEERTNLIAEAAVQGKRRELNEKLLKRMGMIEKGKTKNEKRIEGELD
jgi:choline-sulfatase